MEVENQRDPRVGAESPRILGNLRRRRSQRNQDRRGQGPLSHQETMIQVMTQVVHRAVPQVARPVAHLTAKKDMIH